MIEPIPPLDEMRSLRFLWTYPAYSQNRIKVEEERIRLIRSWGFDVVGFGLPCPGGWWSFPTLDQKWRSCSPDLMAMYQHLEEIARTRDVLFSAGGAMLHPDFLKQLNTYNVLICADDPESSEILSRPVAPTFDFSFVNNIACVDDYRRWGCKQVQWIFHPVRPELSDPTLTKEKILHGERDIDIVMFCERVYGLSDRAQRIERLVGEFPQAFIRGQGWPGGFISHEEMVDAHRRAKIGWNLHNSIGPTNTRLVSLPAFGIMQICDNKSHLAKIFQLDREVVGFDTIEECIDKTRYYLAHDAERREIAARGWERTVTEFSSERWWAYMLDHIRSDYVTKNPPPASRNEVRTVPNRAAALPEHDHTPARVDKPRVLLLVDRPDWAYDAAAKAIAAQLSDTFDFKIVYVIDQPDLSAWPFDLLYVFFWGETYHQRFGIAPHKIIKELSSHRWENEDRYGRLSAAQLAEKYLHDAGTITCTSVRLLELISPHRKAYLVPNGFDSAHCFDAQQRSGPLKLGWAGNLSDPCKGVRDVLEPAIGEDFDLHVAGGDLNAEQMQAFYNQMDVICVASTAEGEPLTLVEAMASGCYPVCVDVGIVPELVKHRHNGLIINRTVPAFRAAFQWCAANVERVREAGRQNATMMRDVRTWEKTQAYWRLALEAALRLAEGSVDAAPRPAEGEQGAMAHLKANYYDHFKVMNPAGAHESTYRASCYYYSAELSPQLPTDMNASILDVGAGFGHLMRFLLDRGYRRIGGVEIDPRLHQEAVAHVGHRADFLVRDDAMNFLKQHPATFDFITAYDIIEHFTMEEAVELSRLIYAALKPGGSVIMRTPNMANILGIYSRYIDLTHQTGFTEFSLAQLLNLAGFQEAIVQLPQWDPSHPQTAKLKESEAMHRTLFALQDRATPTCFEKNVVMVGRKHR